MNQQLERFLSNNNDVSIGDVLTDAHDLMTKLSDRLGSTTWSGIDKRDAFELRKATRAFLRNIKSRPR